MTAQEPITVPFVGKDEGRHQKYDTLEDGGVLLLITPDKDEEKENEEKSKQDAIDKEFNELIAEADGYYELDNLESALKKYEAALVNKLQAEIKEEWEAKIEKKKKQRAEW